MNEFDFLHNGFDSDKDFSLRPDHYKLVEIVLVEDDRIFAKSTKKFIERKLNAVVHVFSGPNDCIKFLDSKRENNKNEFCLISDISFDNESIDGLLLLDYIKDRDYNFFPIVMTGFATIENAIAATKKGAYHYLTKPFDLNSLVELIVKGFVEHHQYKKEDLFNSLSRKKHNIDQGKKSIYRNFKIEIPREEDMFCGMIGRSQTMKDVFERIEKVAATNSTVLIHGPSGTGKELVARALHRLSVRNKKDMVAVNCGAIPSELLESELFGHVKGSFTGAISDRKGRFELANNSSIFLDEIGDMPLLLQVKLLRVLQNKEIEKVGGDSTTSIDVRIITATHRNLDDAVRKGDFREDLFYRLNVIPVEIPALSKRREDIPLLISYFLSRFSSADGRNHIDFDEQALEVLMTYDWPGNVRELENLIERLVILRGGNRIYVKDLPAKFLRHIPSSIDQYETLIPLPENGIDLKKTLSEIECSLIRQALEKSSGNKNKASKMLSMNRTTLIEKMKKKNL